MKKWLIITLLAALGGGLYCGAVRFKGDSGEFSITFEAAKAAQAWEDVTRAVGKAKDKLD